MNSFQRKPHDIPKPVAHRFTRDELQVLHPHDPNDMREMTIRVAACAETSEDFVELMGYLALPSDDPSLRTVKSLLAARA